MELVLWGSSCGNRYSYKVPQLRIENKLIPASVPKSADPINLTLASPLLHFITADLTSTPVVVLCLHLSDFCALCFLHPGPQIKAAHHNRVPINQTAEITVPAHPLPIVFNRGSTSATPPAPSRQRTRLPAAEQEGLSGWQSIRRTLRHLEEAESAIVLSVLLKKSCGKLLYSCRLIRYCLCLAR